MPRSADSLTAVINGILWPYLESVGFKKVTNRKFARERNDVIQQLWVDANGREGKKRTCVVACVNFVFGQVDGYMDPHGFRICNGRFWNMGDRAMAEKSMTQVVAALRAHELQALEKIASVPFMLELLEKPHHLAWHSYNSGLERRWRAGDAELLRIADENRRALKL